MASPSWTTRNNNQSFVDWCGIDSGAARGRKTNEVMGSLVDRAGGKINAAGTNTGKIIADRAGTGARGGAKT